MRTQAIAVATLTVLTFVALPHTVSAEVRCDRFDVQAALDGDELIVSLDTDCPDFSEIMVSVSRAYYEKGNSDTYAHYYLDERSTVREWREPRRVPVSHAEWRIMLDEHRKKMSRLGMGYAVARIEDDVEVRMVLPINQEDGRFGKRNANLVGKAVPTDGMRVAKSELRVRYPLSDATAGSEPMPSTDPYSLQIRQSYRVSKKTPLMPVLRPADAMTALKDVKYIPAGHIIDVLRGFTAHGTPWYEVIVRDGQGRRLATGWVNSTALLGQQLEPIQP